MDGHWDGSGDWSAPIFVPSVDELQEFKIQTNTFSPQYGWSMGNAVNVVTKSGSSSFHGGLFEFLRNGYLDANNFFGNRNGLSRPMVKRNQFGFNLGGPLTIPGLYRQRNKTFIFGSYDGLRQATPITAVLTVPTAEQRQGDFSRTFNQNGSLAILYNPFTTRQEAGKFVRDPFPGNRIPQQLMDPVALKLLPFWPLPNRPGVLLTAQNNFVGAMGLPLNGDQYTIRVDHNITQGQRLFTRWSQKRQFIQGVGAFFGADNPGGMGRGEPNPRWDIGLGYNYAITPALLLNATLGWGRWVEQGLPQGAPFQPSSLGLPAALDTFGGPGAFPGISVDGIQGLGSGALSRTPREARTLALDLTHIRGRHTLTMGFTAIDFRLNTFTSSVAGFSFPRQFTQGPDPTKADPNTGLGVASFLLGTGGGSSSGGVTLAANAALSKNFFGWYFNDDFRLRRNLTLNLGVRYDFQTAPTDRFDRLSSWTLEKNSISDATGLNLIGGLRYAGGGNPRSLYDPQYTNIAPRIGFTYSPVSKLVMRAGFGIFYMPAMEFGIGGNWGLALDGFSQITPYVGSLDNNVTPHDLLRNPFPNGLLLPPGKALGDRTDLGLSVNEVERGHPTPYVEQWAYSLQYQLGSNTMLEAAYVGNHGVKLPFGANFQRNQLRPEQLSLGNALLAPAPNPFFGLITTGVLSGSTVPLGRLLRPYPQFDNVFSVQPSAGMSAYHALTVSANRRFSRGLQLLVSFTASKYLTNTEGPEGGVGQTPAALIRNYYDISAEKSLMNDDIPRSLVISYIYELPIGKGKRLAPAGKAANAVIGGWQVTGISSFKSGFPVSIAAVNNNTNSFGGGQRPNIVGNPSLDHPTIDRWFNIGAFAQPAAFTFGNAPRTMPNLRTDGANNWDFSVQKYWGLWSEESKLQFRAEFFNLFNRAGFYTPNGFFGSPAFGLVSQAFPPRSIQLGMKLYW